MIKSLLIHLFSLALLANFSSAEGLSCRDMYRCTSSEVCWNGQCVRKDPTAERRRYSLQYGFDVAKKSKKCKISRDCRGLGGGFVCSKQVCRLIRTA